MYQEDNEKLVQNLQEVIRGLGEKLAEVCEEQFQSLRAAFSEIAEEFARITEELEDPDPVPPNLKRPARGSRSTSNLTRRLDLVLWYTSGFR